MTPTPKLRFVEREMYISQPQTPNVAEKKVVRILQQWWEHTQWNAEGEWRDVPIEKEQA
jgi:hypothetical protein